MQVKGSADCDAWNHLGDAHRDGFPDRQGLPRLVRGDSSVANPRHSPGPQGDNLILVDGDRFQHDGDDPPFRTSAGIIRQHGGGG
jgi:hypothetical protein